MYDGHYEEVDPNFEYLDVSNRSLRPAGILEILQDLAGDRVIKQVNFNYNILGEDFRKPQDELDFIRVFKKILVKHKSSLTALDFRGCHLFDNHPHPSNEHTKNYQVELANALKVSTITHIDLSENNITGNSGRELMGLTYLMKNVMVKGKGLKCRHSQINSQGLWSICHCLGPFSTMTFLDLSCNQCGLDPTGRTNSEGSAALMAALKTSLHLRVLKLADNHLQDEDIVNICEALSYMPQFQDLDVASNNCRTHGARALKDAMLSHSIFSDDRYGFRHIDLSNNPIGEGGITELAEGIRRTYTIKSLKLRCCNVNDAGALVFYDALKVNGSILLLDVDGNDRMSDDATYSVLAEVQANNDVNSLRTDPFAVDAGTLTKYAYNALSRKLRFLNKPQLAALHKNPSFNIPETEMQEALHLLEPPGRHELVQEIRLVDVKMQERLFQSALALRKLRAAKVIYNHVLEWFEPKRLDFNIKKAIAAAAKRKALKNAHNDEDDKFAKYNK